MTMFKEIAWNGISFSRPDAWQPVTIDKKHLLLAEDGRQIMEIKWGPGGEDTPQTYIEKLSASFKKQLGSPIKQTKLPVEWQKALQDFSAASFAWQGCEGEAQGLVIHCPHCNTITLMQFFLPLGSQSIITDILQSYADHSCDSWAIFDLSFQIPEPYIIKHYRFAAGCFELHFSAGKSVLKLKRMAPAKQLLRGKNLQQLATEVMEVGITSSATATEVNWQQTTSGFLTRLGKRLTKEALCRSGRMWLDSTNNRILTLEVDSMQGIEPNEFSQICTDFRITP